MSTNVRREDDLPSSAQPSSRARAEAPDLGGRHFALPDLNVGYTSDELDAHANEQLQPRSAANSNAVMARVRQPRQPLRANASRAVFRSGAVRASVRPPEPCELPSVSTDDEAASADPAEPSTT